MNLCYQVEKKYGSYVRPKSKILVRKYLDGSISAWHKEERLSITHLDRRPAKVEIQDQIKQQRPMNAHQAGRIGKHRSPMEAI